MEPGRFDEFNPNLCFDSFWKHLLIRGRGPFPAKEKFLPRELAMEPLLPP